MYYFIAETNNYEQHAGTKARQDVSNILTTMGWRPLTVRKRFGGSTLDKFKAIPDVYFDWRKITCSIESSDTVLIQYPVNTYPKVAPFALPAIRRMRSKGAKIVMVIHDLERLRTNSDVSEDRFFALADAVICHNDVMKSMLRERYPSLKLISLDVFDYLTDEPTHPIDERNGIDIAGNLNPGKSAYVYELAKSFPQASFHLYGPFFNVNSAESRWYRGSFPPEKLPSILNGKFGLVWDGDSTTTCSGAKGEYMRINNPHKLSLYLASNEPVIIWHQAAEAGFVKNNNLGIVASSIADAIIQIDALTDQDYISMTQSVHAMCEKVRSGYHLRKAIDESLKLVGE